MCPDSAFHCTWKKSSLHTAGTSHPSLNAITGILTPHPSFTRRKANNSFWKAILQDLCMRSLTVF